MIGTHEEIDNQNLISSGFLLDFFFERSLKISENWELIDSDHLAVNYRLSFVFKELRIDSDSLVNRKTVRDRHHYFFQKGAAKIRDS